MRRTLAALAVAAAALAATLVAAPAWAAPTGCTGVWVVVDAAALGGEVTTACAPAHATGSEALTSAGFELSRGSNMICRIDGLPERCEIAATAYWSYWQAAPSGDEYGEWTYATLGPDSSHPAGGTAEGWVFGDGSAPPAAVPPELAQAGQPASASPAASQPAEPTAPTANAVAGPLGLAAVVVGLVVVVGGVYLARRRAG